MNFLTYPFYKLYLHGPRWGSVGFWEGRAREDICAEITGTPAVFWAFHTEECDRMIDRKVMSMAVLVAVSTYTYTVCAGVIALLRGVTGLAGGYVLGWGKKPKEKRATS